MHKFNKSAFIAAMTLLCYAGFATAQVVSFDSAGDLGSMVKELKFGGQGGHGGNVPTPPTPSPFNGGGHNGPGGHNGGGDNGHNNGGWNNDHNNPGHNGGWNPQPGPGNHNDHNGGHNDNWHPQPNPWNPQPGPWHPQPGPWNPGPQPGPWNPGPQPGPWNPGPQPGQWHPHHNGHPDWNNNDWANNHWNNHGNNHYDWWNSYNYWWSSSQHPYSMFRTVCDVNPGVSAKGFIVEQSLPFYGRATFYYYNAFDNLIGTSNPMSSVFSGGNGTPVFDFYQVPSQADHCFLAVTQ